MKNSPSIKFLTEGILFPALVAQRPTVARINLVRVSSMKNITLRQYTLSVQETTSNFWELKSKYIYHPPPPFFLYAITIKSLSPKYPFTSFGSFICNYCGD